MSDYDKLLEELNTLGDEAETMFKAISDSDGADESDDKIKGAAGAAGDDGDDGDGDESDYAGDDDGGDDDGDDGDGDDGEPMGKSFLLQLEDGTEVEAFDGTEMMKSLQLQLKASEDRSNAVLEQAVGLVRKQGDMIKSLQDTVAKLQSSGRGRKTVLSVAEPGNTTMKKSEEVAPAEFMAKALTAQKEGRITGFDVSRMESYMNKGMSIPQDLVDKVLQ